jgi:ABC-type multidrug transport system ATPase subunit
MTLRITGLRKRFGAVEAVRDATFDARAGEVLGLLGPNGAGKSTILACLAGLLAADGGAVTRGGAPLAPADRRDALFYLPDGVLPWPDQRVEWVLDFGRALHGGSADWRDDLAESLGIGALRGRRLGELSKGQRRRVLLAYALATPQPALLMDEPFDGLDLRQTRDAIALFRRVAAAGRTLVLSIHSMRDAERVCDRLVLLSDGRTAAEGTLAELRARAGLPNADLEEVFLALA